MRWIGLNDGYVSGDGLFFVTPVMVSGPRGMQKRWTVFGLVRFEAVDGMHMPWTWTDAPLYGPVSTKRACQDWAKSSGYQARSVSCGEPSVAPKEDKPVGYEYCRECGVHFPRKPRHTYDDYCGVNCFGDVVDRVEDIRANLRRSA